MLKLFFTVDQTALAAPVTADLIEFHTEEATDFTALNTLLVTDLTVFQDVLTAFNKPFT
ncbi:hypothetical protein ACFQ7T_30030 [Bacillus cereus]|uniref:hypothetical protein n=1 Tax=Bacillus cereus TaxID=1396 RepID=UPI00366EA792